MTKKISIKVFGDPGHAWARFPKAKLVSLGIADKITPYSYQNGTNAFLEEDCDLGLAVDFYKESGITFSVKSVIYNKDCKIRRYERCNYSN